jgi:undecaprenyl phosphate N,N'-diacetylbacillosamine 1-phosphate transferase
MNYINSFLKRVMDIFIALIAITLLLPIIISLAILIKIDSKGPILFTQTRVGKGKVFFKIYKFRTMAINADKVKDGLQVKAGDTRITRFGTFLRKTSLDEIPQFFNVLKGDISLVGPRPALPEQLHYYNDTQMRRLEMQPGITGLATINGRASIPWSKRIAYDVEYIDNFSFYLDLKIIFNTFFVVLSGKDTYYDHTNGPAFDLADPDDLPQSGQIKIKDNKNGNR